MKKFSFLVTFALIVLVLVASPCTGQVNGFVEGQTRFNDGSATNQINLSLGGNLSAKNHLGWFVWALVSEGWAESYVGLAYSPADWIAFQAGYGIETADDSGRFGGNVWIGKGANSVFFAYEDGGSGPWHKLVLNHSFGKFGIGVLDQSFLGTGPRVEIKTGKVKVWAAQVWLKGKPTTTAAVSYNF